MPGNRSLRQWGRRAVLAIGLGALIAATGVTPIGHFLHRLGIDVLLPARHAVFGPLFPAAQSAAVAVVIDEETYRTPPFSETPKVAWTPMLARILDKIDAAGATVIGLDLIYPTTLDTRTLLPGYDKPLLKTFYRIGRAGRLVLGEVRLSQQAIRPYKGQVAAAGGPGNLRPLNLLLDADEVIRSYPLAFSDERGGRIRAFSVELAARAGIAPPPGDFLINYNTGANDIPTYSLADLFHCAETGSGEFFSRAFAGKIVIVGSALDVEDRQVPAKRFANAAGSGDRSQRCALPFDPSRFGQIVDRHTMPGIYIHAAAVNTLAKSNALELLGPGASCGLLTAGVAGLALLFFVLPPVFGFLATLAAVAGHLGLALLAFRSGVVLPVLSVAAAGSIAFAVIYAYRVVVEDKMKRRIKKAFGHYLAPSLVERLAGESAPPELGGELRRVTVMFTDIAGYTTLAETLSEQPDRLVTILNRYFTVISTIVEDHGGYVVSYVGDAVMAAWGAPSSDPEAERHAVEAALACQKGLGVFNREVIRGEYGLPGIGTRFGINSGIALVGNTGSATRLGYTVTGDTTNLAARLEAANKIYGTQLMIGEETARRLSDAFVLRRLDRLVVKGKSKPVKVYEVVGHAPDVSEERLGRIREFHAAMALYYRRRFASALEAFSRLTASDEAARVYSERCLRFEKTPPPVTWDRSFVSETK